MNKKGTIYYVEGLPGCGKTTISNWIQKELGGTLFSESMSDNPNHFFEVAGMPDSEYSVLLHQYPDIAEYTEHIEGYKYVKIDEVKRDFPNNNAMIRSLSRWDIGDEYNLNISSTYFMKYTLPRIRSWVKSIADTTNPIIMDSIWLQNPINEMLYRNADAKSIEEYCSLIAQAFSGYKLICIYLKHRNVIEGIKFASKVKGGLWTSRVVDSICRTPYGIVNNLQGLDGLIYFFTTRAEIEKRILSTNIINYYEYCIDDYNWDKIRANLARDIF